MESLYLLIPLSVVLVLLIGAVLAWAALSGQFENLESEGARILGEGEVPADPGGPAPGSGTPRAQGGAD